MLITPTTQAALDEHNTQRVARLLKDLSRHTQAREYVRCALGIEIQAPRGGLSLARAPCHYTSCYGAGTSPAMVPHCTSTSGPSHAGDRDLAPPGVSRAGRPHRAPARRRWPHGRYLRPVARGTVPVQCSPYRQRCITRRRRGRGLGCVEPIGCVQPCLSLCVQRWVTTVRGVSDTASLGIQRLSPLPAPVWRRAYMSLS